MTIQPVYERQKERLGNVPFCRLLYVYTILSKCKRVSLILTRSSCSLYFSAVV